MFLSYCFHVLFHKTVAIFFLVEESVFALEEGFHYAVCCDSYNSTQNSYIVPLKPIAVATISTLVSPVPSGERLR